jgi:predicted MFS family arabinose efflux permease
VKKTNRPKVLLFIPVVFVALTLFLFLNKDALRFPVRSEAVPVELPTYAGGNGGRTAMIFENEEKSVVVFNAEQHLIYKLKAEPGKANSFSNAKFVEIDETDNLYILDTHFAGAFEENVERVLKYSPAGEFLEELYAYRYINEDYIITKGKIGGMAYFEGSLYLVRMEHDGFYLEKTPASSSGETERVLFLEYPNAFRDLIYFHINVKQQRFVFTAKSGEIRQYDFSGKLTYTRDAEEGWVLPWTAVSDDDNSIIYTEILSGSIVGINTGSGEKTVLFTAPPESSSYYRINYVNGNLFAASYDNVLKRSGDGEIEILDSYFYEPAIIKFQIALFVIAILDGIALLGTLALVIPLLRKLAVSESLKRILLSGMCIAFGAVIAAILIINEMDDRYERNTFNNLENVSRLVAASVVDTDLLDSLVSPSQYSNEEYLRLKDSLKVLFSRTQFKGDHVYQIIYVVRGNDVLVMYDLENSVGICYPFTEYEGSIYQETADSGEYAHVEGSVDSEGSWMFVCGPIFDREGNVAAIIETGYDRRVVEEQTRSLIVQTILIVIAAAVALLLVMIEGILILDAYKKNKLERIEKKTPVFRPELLRAAFVFLVDAYKKNKLGKMEKKAAAFHPELLRAVVFFLFVVFNLATAMLPMYAANLYVPIFNLPRELVITFPFISDTIFAALALLVIPNLLGRVGVKKIVLAAAILIALGNLLCFAAVNSIYLTIAYALTGFSGGAILLAINTIIGAQKNVEDINSGFAHFNASYLAGVNVGVVFGSVLAQFFPYRIVYLFSTLVSLVLLYIIIFSIRSNSVNHIYNVDIRVDRRKGALIKFLFKPVVLVTLILLILPYVASLSFTSYFMPIYGIENGLRESNIGQLILLNGLFAILFGTSLCEYVSKKVSLKVIIALSLALNAGAMYLFSLNMSIGMLVAVIVILAIANIFALTNIQTYYTTLYQGTRVSSSKALGVYSAVENISMAVGPVAFSYMAAKNIAGGMRLFAVILLACLALFILSARIFKEKKKQETV